MSAETRVDQVAGAVDDRFGTSSFLRKAVKKAFPDHWSFLLGEIALYSFVVIVLTGTFLTLFFKPSASEVVYQGSYAPLHGVRMSEAYASTLRESFDVRGGLLMRQIHHWSALIFLASMLVHMLRVFFTGAFRKPRDISWLLGVTLLILGILEGFFGYSLPDDLLSGTGLRIAQGVVQSTPIVGTYLSFFLFGGQFPGTDLIPRLYITHVLLIPGIMLALVPLHGVVLPWRLKHTHFPSERRRTEENQIGKPFFPAFILKTTSYFLYAFTAAALLATFVQINPVWMFGPYTPDAITAGSQPDWYLGFMEGALRIMPRWEILIAGHPISLSVLIPGVVIPGILFTGLMVYPWAERWITQDHRVHNLLDRPRNAATRTALGAAGCAFYGFLWAAGGNDVIAVRFHVSLYATTWVFRFLVVFGPIIAYIATKRICLGLQRRDLETLHHGVETGVIKQLPSGEFQEVTRRVSDDAEAVLTAKKKLPVLEAASDENGIPEPASRQLIGRLRIALNRAYTADDPTANGNGHHANGHGNGNGNGHALDNGNGHAAQVESAEPRS